MLESFLIYLFGGLTSFLVWLLGPTITLLLMLVAILALAVLFAALLANI